MHWINLSEKAAMKFLQFCSPPHPALSEKVSRGSRGQVLRGDIEYRLTQDQSQVGVVGMKSTNTEGTSHLATDRALGLWVTHAVSKSLDKSRPAHDPAHDLATMPSQLSEGDTPNAQPNADDVSHAVAQPEPNAEPCRVSGVWVWSGRSHAERHTYTSHTHDIHQHDRKMR